MVTIESPAITIPIPIIVQPAGPGAPDGPMPVTAPPATSAAPTMRPAVLARTPTIARSARRRLPKLAADGRGVFSPDLVDPASPARDGTPKLALGRAAGLCGYAVRIQVTASAAIRVIPQTAPTRRT